MLETRPTPKLEDHPLSATANSIYSQLLSILEVVPPSATWGRAMPWWRGPTYHGFEGPRASISRSSSLEMKALRCGEWSGRVYPRPGVTYLKTWFL